jgi:hypothetical protein
MNIVLRSVSIGGSPESTASKVISLLILNSLYLAESIAKLASIWYARRLMEHLTTVRMRRRLFCKKRGVNFFVFFCACMRIH